MKKKAQPFVVDMRHDQTGDSTYAVRDTYQQALLVAGEFWKDYDHDFNPKDKQPFKVGQGYEPELDVGIRGGKVVYVIHAEGQGPCIFIQRAK